jgi:hypothetical protein
MGTLSVLGAISTRKIAIPKLNGTPMSSAIAEVTSVPITYGSAPKISLPSTGFQAEPKKKLEPNRCKTGTEPDASVYAVNVRMIMAEAATTAAIILNRLSPVNLVFEKNFRRFGSFRFLAALTCW